MPPKNLRSVITQVTCGRGGRSGLSSRNFSTHDTGERGSLSGYITLAASGLAFGIFGYGLASLSFGAVASYVEKLQMGYKDQVNPFEQGKAAKEN